MNFKILAIVLLLLTFCHRLFLQIVEYRSDRNPIPANVSNIYDKAEYERWRSYHHERIAVSMASLIIETICFLVLIGFDLYAGFAALFGSSDFAGIIAVVLLEALSGLTSVPVAYIEKIKIEGKYGFNRSTLKLFIMDEIKELIIGLVLSLLLSSIYMLLYKWLGDLAVIMFAVFLILFMLVISFISPYLMRIFYKYTPLEDGELKEKLTALLEKNGYKVRAIQVMNASSRSTKSNAFFAGFGKLKTVVLYDTLIQAMSTDEICAVFAHELGHGLHHDTLKQQFLSMLQMILIALCIWANIHFSDICLSFGFSSVNYAFALILAVSVEMQIIAPLMGLISSYASRKAEYQADLQAVREGYGEALKSALTKLAKENYANLAPSSITVALEYSHPTISQRLSAIDQAASK